MDDPRATRMLVTGATGRLGREVVRMARGRGHQVRALSRQPAPGDGTVAADLVSGEGLSAALAGVDVVVHAASDPRPGGRTDTEGTRRLVEAAGEAGVSHLLLVSIVGVDRIPFEYYARKMEAERIVAAGPVPHTIQRATQFHEFVDEMLTRLARAPLVLPVPGGFCVQSIAARDVAAVLCDLAASSPTGRRPDLAGPEVLPLERAARLWVRARRPGRPIFRFWWPGRTAAAFRRGYNTAPDRAYPGQTWQDWLGRERRGRQGAWYRVESFGGSRALEEGRQ